MFFPENKVGAQDHMRTFVPDRLKRVKKQFSNGFDLKSVIEIFLRSKPKALVDEQLLDMIFALNFPVDMVEGGSTILWRRGIKNRKEAEYILSKEDNSWYIERKEK